MYTIRQAELEDFKEIHTWWEGELDPLNDPSVPKGGAYLIVDNNGNKLVYASLYLTNGRRIALVDQVVSNPKFRGLEVNKAVEVLQQHISEVAANMGYTNLVCIQATPGLIKRLNSLGYKSAIKNADIVVKNLREERLG